MHPTRIEEINSELKRLQVKYEKKMVENDGCRPPAIKSGILTGIIKKMDRLDKELANLSIMEVTQNGNRD